MTTPVYKQVGLLLFLLLLALITAATTRYVSAQSSSLVAITAQLSEVNQDPALHRGSMLATLAGTDLRLVGFFTNLTTPWGSVDLYQGAPGEQGTYIQNLLLSVGPGTTSGGLDNTVTLSEAQAQALRDGLLYVSVTGQAPGESLLRGQLSLVQGAADLFETGLWAVPLAPLPQRGSLLATLTGTDLRLVGFFTNLTTPWGSVDLHQGAPGEPGAFIENLLLSVGQSTTSYGFDATVTLSEAEAQALRDGLFYVSVTRHGTTQSALRGQLLLAPNEAPLASEILTPAEGATLEIGGVGGAEPVDPATVLATMAFSPAEDPNQNRVAYRWQVSRDADFSYENRTYAVDLGVDSTSLLLTVEAAATLFDALTNRSSGDILLDTPLTLYHRVLTTDGSLYTKGPAKTITFTRGLITAHESEGDVPRTFAISGNYPNPFNPATTLVFALPAQADVAVAVYDLLGRQVLALPAQPMAAGAAQRITIDASHLTSGTYLYRVAAHAATQTWIDSGQMTLVK